MIQTKLSGGTHWLEPTAAASFERCLAAGAPNAIESAGRTWEAQQALLKRYGYPRAELPARSFHVKGQAIDAQAPLIAWFLAHPEHGWRRTVTAEPWHFQYFPHLDTQEDDMPLTEQDVLAVAHAVWTTQIDRGAKVSTKQDMADTGTIARQILAAVQSASAPVIDYDALAAKIPAPKIDYAALAKAVNDDAARRMQG